MSEHEGGAGLSDERLNFTWSLSRNVSLNRANPHRLTATCACGTQFLRMACSDRVDRYRAVWVREAFQRHLTEEHPQ